MKKNKNVKELENGRGAQRRCLRQFRLLQQNRRMNSLNHTHLFLTFLETRHPRLWCQGGWVLVMDLFQIVFSSGYILTGQKKGNRTNFLL